MKNVYPVIFTITNDKKDTVLIQVPDFDILSEGYGMVNAIEMARDAIGLTGITLEDMEKDIPSPTNINEIDLNNAEFRDAGQSIVSMVDIDFAVYRRRLDTKAVRRNVTLPKWLNQEAERAGIACRVSFVALAVGLIYPLQAWIYDYAKIYNGYVKDML